MTHRESMLTASGLFACAIACAGCAVINTHVVVYAPDTVTTTLRDSRISARLEATGVAQRERESVDTRDDGEYPSFTAGVSNKASRADCFQPVPR